MTTLPAREKRQQLLDAQLCNTGRRGDVNAKRQPRHDQRRWLEQIEQRLIFLFRFALPTAFPSPGLTFAILVIALRVKVGIAIAKSLASKRAKPPIRPALRENVCEQQFPPAGNCYRAVDHVFRSTCDRPWDLARNEYLLRWSPAPLLGAAILTKELDTRRASLDSDEVLTYQPTCGSTRSGTPGRVGIAMRPTGTTPLVQCRVPTPTSMCILTGQPLSRQLNDGQYAIRRN